MTGGGQMVSDEKLEQFLDEHGVAWEIASEACHLALANEWESIYGKVWRLGMRHTKGVRARHEYSQRSAETFFIVPFLSKRANPHHAVGPNATAAYKCQHAGELPDLSEFAGLEFFISPPDLSWTMVHTHEDDAIGGPY